MIGMAVVLAVMTIGAGCTDDSAPHLDSATPSSAQRGATIALAGRHLCGASGNCSTAAGEVQVGESLPAVLAQVVSYSDSAAQIVVPSMATVGSTSIIVTVNEQASNALAFEVLP